MGKASDQGFGDSVAEIVGIGISTQIGERQYGNRINLACFAGAQVPNEDCRQSDGNNATTYNNPEPAALEGSVRQCWYSGCSAGVGVGHRATIVLLSLFRNCCANCLRISASILLLSNYRPCSNALIH